MKNIICVLLSKNNTFVSTETYNRFLDLPDEIYGEFRLLETIGNTYVYKNMKRNATFLKNALRGGYGSMNKYKKALENIWLAINCNAIPVDDVMKKDLATLQELVDKETPMKPNDVYETKERVYYNEDSFKYEKILNGNCPRCDKELNEFYDYCIQCGQKLDWSDKDEQH